MVSLNPVRSAAQRVGSACNGDWSSDVPSRKCDATLFLRLPVCFPCYNSGPCPSWFVGHSTLGLDEGGPWVGIGWSEGSQDTWEQAGSGNGLGLEGRGHPTASTIQVCLRHRVREQRASWIGWVGAGGGLTSLSYASHVRCRLALFTNTQAVRCLHPLVADVPHNCNLQQMRIVMLPIAAV